MTLATVSCERRKLTLTMRGCAALWGSANLVRPEPAPWEGRHACLRCPIGAGHAGRPIDPMADAVAALRPVCPRCRRAGLRMIRDRLCVSCYNRQREMRTGRNAKGHPPKVYARRLIRLAVAMVATDGLHRIDAADVTGMAEVLLSKARVATAPVAFGWGRGHG